MFRYYDVEIAGLVYTITARSCRDAITRAASLTHTVPSDATLVRVQTGVWYPLPAEG